MRTVNALNMNKMDHDDVQENARGEKERQKYRLNIIKNFMKFAKTQKLEGEEKVVIDR